MSHPTYRRIGSIEGILIEECAEVAEHCLTVIHLACKWQRFGILNKPPKSKLANWELMLGELKDLRHAIGRVEHALAPLKKQKHKRKTRC